MITIGKLYVKEKLSDHRFMTPEGFLMCPAVPVARIGTLEYSASEVPDIETENGVVEMYRSTDSLFNEKTMASCNGKPLLAGFHMDVTPENFKSLVVGNMQNARRGIGDQADLLLADLLICDDDAIKRVQDNEIKELSIGYTANCSQTEVGKGTQYDIIVNHASLVEVGRAGKICSIGDKKGANNMADEKQAVMDDAIPVGALEKVLTLFGFKPKMEGEDEITVDPGGDVNERLTKIEEVLSKLVPMEEAEHGAALSDEEKDTKIAELEAKLAALEKAEDETEQALEENVGAVGDEEFGDEMNEEEVAAVAECIAPGLSVSDGDAAQKSTSLRYGSLIEANKSPNAAAVIKLILGDHAKDISKAPKPLVGAAFRALGEAAKETRGGETRNLGFGHVVFGDTMKENAPAKPVYGSDLGAIYKAHYQKGENK